MGCPRARWALEEIPMGNVGSRVSVFAVVVMTLAVACGSGAPPPSSFADAAPDRVADGHPTTGSPPDAATDASPGAIDLGSPHPDTGPSCTGLTCLQTGTSTAVSGKVYDPAGVNGLYNVFVYVPNAPLDPIASGPQCTPCQAPASGDPIASTTTLPDGTFTLTDVPDGVDVPIVLQLGKWRRHLTLPVVTQCADNAPP